MLIDADTHYAHPDLFDHLSFQHTPWLEFRKKTQNTNFAIIDRIWKSVYANICDDSWPTVPNADRFHVLPKHIRQEIAEHDLGDIFVAKDLSKIKYKFPDPSSTLPDIDELVDICQNRLGVDRALINVQPYQQGIGYYVSPAEAVELMTTYNRGMLDVVKPYNKFDLTAWLALQDIQASEQELDWIIDNDFFAVFLSFHPAWGFIPRAKNIFAKCNKAGMPIYLHPTAGRDTPFDYNTDWTVNCELYQKMKQRWPSDGQSWKITVASIITEYIMKGMPDLKILVIERGINWIKEIEEFFAEQGLPNPLPILKNNFWYSTEVEHPTFLRDAEYIGWDRVMFSTDYPHNEDAGLNKYKDAIMLEQYVNSGKINSHDYELFSHKNYLKLKQR